jgi:hypothetical protein
MSSIAILTPVCSRNQNYTSFQDIPFVNYLHKSLLATIDAQHEYTIFIGVDSTDKFYVEHLGDFLFLNAPANLVIKPIILYDCEHKPAFAWNKLFQEAYNRGHDYFFQIGDDVEISGDWTNKFIESIESNDGVGVTGCLEKWNAACRRAKGQPLCLENAFVGRKHYELFGSFFNEIIENWFCDEWITQVYSPDYVTVHDNLEVKNKVRYDGDNAVGECTQQDNQSFRYKVKNIESAEFEQMIQSDRKKVFVDQLQKTSKLAIALICTKQEYQSGQVNKMLDLYFARKPSHTKTFDLFIFFDQGNPQDYANLLTYEQHQSVSKIHIDSIDISDYLNIYSHERDNKKIISEFYKLNCPKFGITSGPNILFFESMKRLSHHNHEYILLLEADTRPIKDLWLDGILEYLNVNDFLIGGSIYKGDHQEHLNSEWSDHLNGVAIYKNSQNFQSLIEATESALLYIISTSKRLIDQYHFTDITDDVPRNAGIDNLCVQLNYDILMYYIAKDSEKYQQIGNNLQDTSIITNMSLRTDYHIAESDVLARHPETIILHQKF